MTDTTLLPSVAECLPVLEAIAQGRTLDHPIPRCGALLRKAYRLRLIEDSDPVPILTDKGAALLAR